MKVVKNGEIIGLGDCGDDGAQGALKMRVVEAPNNVRMVSGALLQSAHVGLFSEPRAHQPEFRRSAAHDHDTEYACINMLVSYLVVRFALVCIESWNDIGGAKGRCRDDGGGVVRDLGCSCSRPVPAVLVLTRAHIDAVHYVVVVSGGGGGVVAVTITVTAAGAATPRSSVVSFAAGLVLSGVCEGDGDGSEQ